MNYEQPNNINHNTPNIQQMLTMMNNYMNNQSNNYMKNQFIFDPRRTDRRMKITLMNQTISQTKIGLFKSLPCQKAIVYSFISDFNSGIPNRICNVEVQYDHVLDVLENYAIKGINFSVQNNWSPVVLNLVGREFSGTNLELNEHIRDELINIRTTFNNTIKDQYPLKDEECTYVPNITIIRPKYPTQFLGWPQTYRTALITTSPILTDKLLSDNKMKITDLIKTLTIIETVFQVAISKGHHVLILPPFGHEDDNNPVEDIIKLYNYCILKYGHFFNKIIIGIPKYYPKGIYDTYLKDIIKPQEVTSLIDKKFEQESMKRELLEKTTQQEKSPINNQTLTQEQMEMFMKMMALSQQQTKN